MSDLAARLLAHVRARHLFPEPGLALLAVSGGPDSVALVDLMTVAAPELRVDLAVAHVDHGIAADSAIVAERVRALAEARGLRCEITTLALGANTSETEARAARYAALRGYQQRLGARYLVTAHQADDQVETILFRLLKGSGNAGLAGIPAVGPDGLVRPLLPFRRQELKAWLDQRLASGALTFDVHTDPANFDPRHDRSWLRHHILPALRGRLPEVEANILARGRLASEERRAWSAVLRALPALDVRVDNGTAEMDRAPLTGFDAALAETLVRALGREAGCRIGAATAARVVRLVARGQSGRTIELGAGWVAELVFERLRIRRDRPASADDAVGWGVQDAGEATFGRWTIRWDRDAAGKATRAGLVTWVTPGSGMLRSYTSGDRVRPLGGTGRRAVSRLLMEARVPRLERRHWPVLVRESEVLWIPGVCRGATAVPAPGTPAIRLEAQAQH